MLLTDKTYNILKWFIQYFLPIIGGLYSIGFFIFDFPFSKEVVGSILILIMFFEIILKISSVTYQNSGKDTDGTLQIEKRDLKDIYRLQLNSELEKLAEKKKITLLVDSNAKLSD